MPYIYRAKHRMLGFTFMSLKCYYSPIYHPSKEKTTDIKEIKVQEDYQDIFAMFCV